VVFFARETRVNNKTSTIQTQRSPPQEEQSAHRRLLCGGEAHTAFLLKLKKIKIVFGLQAGRHKFPGEMAVADDVSQFPREI